MVYPGGVRLLSCSLLLLIAFATGCGSSSTTLLNPAGPSGRCAVALNSSASSISSAGASGTIRVSTERECPWTLRAESDWLTFSVPTTGQGTAELAFSVQPNRSTSPRSIEVSVADQRVTISQEAGSCPWSVSPTQVSMGPAGGDQTISLATEDFCSWGITASDSWLTVTSASDGKGNASIVLRIAKNDGRERVATLEVGGATIPVRQREGTPPPAVPPVVTPPPVVVPPPNPGPGPTPPPLPVTCTFQVAPTAFNNVSSSQSPLQVDVTTQGGCEWNAASNATWVTISSGTSGTGNGRVELTAAENTGAARSGTLVVAGQTVTVNQQAPAPTPVPCTFQVAPTAFNNVASSQSPLQVDVTTQAGCAWTAASNAAWVTISSGGSGTGNGRVELTAAENTGAGRSGTLVIAGETVTVNQQAAPPTPVPCTFQVAPTAFNNVAFSESQLQVDVTTQAGCTWSAVSNAAWVTISSGANGTGNGRVQLTAAENTGAVRSGTLVIAGETVSVSQQGPPPCAYTIGPSSYSPSSAGGSVTVTVTTTSGCAWVVAGNSSWASAKPASGTGARHDCDCGSVE